MASPGYRNLPIDVPGKPGLAVRARKGVTVGSGSEYAGPDGGPQATQYSKQ
jgi:hypothetical protein